MAHGAFDGVIRDPLPGRTHKPRTCGETMVIDKGLGLSETSDLLELAAEYIDYIKLTFGTAGLYSLALLKAKVALIRSYGIGIYPGGTYLEVALLQDRLAAYLERARAVGFTHIEMSEGQEPNRRSTVSRWGKAAYGPSERNLLKRMEIALLLEDDYLVGRSAGGASVCRTNLYPKV